MSAVAEATSSLVAQRSNTIVFLARREELRLVKTPRYPQVAPASGQRLGETRGQTFAFIDGTLRLTPDADGNVHILDPGEATLPLEEALAFLRGHRRFRDVNEGFWEVDPTAPPIAQEELDRIVAAATDWDTETLEEVVRQERAGWNRKDLLHVAEGSLERIRAMEAKAEEAVAAKNAEVDEERAQREAIQRQLDAALKEQEKLKAAARKANG
jgi:hypothetical protein